MIPRIHLATTNRHKAAEIAPHGPQRESLLPREFSLVELLDAAQDEPPERPNPGFRGEEGLQRRHR